MILPAPVRLSMLVALGVAAAACGVSRTPSTAAPTPNESAARSPVDRDTVSPPTAATTRPPAPLGSLPPAGFLDGGDGPVEGWVGSFCWDNTCADMPGLPEMDDLPRVVTSETQLVFSLDNGTAFDRWHASYTLESGPGGTGQMVTLGQGGAGFDPDARPSPDGTAFTDAMFAAPPGGDSTVLVQAWNARGDVSYAWHVKVPKTPPTGRITMPEGTAAPGHLGSWCYDVGCADSPAFAKELLPELRVGPGESLTFEFAEGDEFAFAEAVYAEAMDFAELQPLATAGVYVDPDDASVTPGPPLSAFDLQSPPRGDWALRISVRFPGDLGDAPYWWHAIVE